MKYRLIISILILITVLFSGYNNSSVKGGRVVGKEAGEKTRKTAISDPYLEKAFQDLKVYPPSALSKKQHKMMDVIIEDIKDAANKEKIIQVDKDTARFIGISGIPFLSPLLRDNSPYIRYMAAETLFTMHRKESIPFLIGLLTDKGQFTHEPVTISYAVSRWLQKAVYQTIYFRVPLDYIGQPMAYERAMQNWYDYHLPYYSWKEHTEHGQYWFNGLALYSSTPASSLEWAKNELTEKFDNMLVIVAWPEPTKTEECHETTSKIITRFIFHNFTDEIVQIHWDRQKRNIHQLRLVGPDEKEVPMLSGSIEPLSDGVPEMQSLWSGGSSPIGWSLPLHKVYDLSKHGRYRLYYSYIPPKIVGEKEYSKRVDLRFWSGREYTNYYEFLITGKKKR